MSQAKPSISRSTRPDLVAALCRNSTYINDVEKNMKWLALASSNDLCLLDCGIRNGKAVIRPLSPVGEEANSAASAVCAFLNRWPMLRRPIPPKGGRENPQKYVEFLRDAVEIIQGDQKGRGVIVQIGWKPWKTASSHNIDGGRFLTVRIDLSRSPEEITAAVKRHVADYQRDWQEYDSLDGRITLPPAGSKAKGQGRNVDRWKVYDVFLSKGNQDVKKTAQILFPSSYRYRNDKAEVKKEIDEWLDNQGGRTAPSGVLTEYDKKQVRMRCSTARQRERERIEKRILAAVEACKRMIESQIPTLEI